MLQIPIISTPNQIIFVQVGTPIQNVELTIYQKFYGLFMDVVSNGASIVNGVLCQNLNYIVRSAYLGFSGDFTFIDNQGIQDPDYTGLGKRFSLLYITEAEIPIPTSLSTFSD